MQHDGIKPGPTGIACAGGYAIVQRNTRQEHTGNAPVPQQSFQPCPADTVIVPEG